MLPIPNKWVLAGLLSALVLGGVSSWSYKKGAENTQQAWDRERATLLAEALKIEQSNRQKESAHRLETIALENRLKEAEARYEEAIAAIHADYDRRLRSSDERATRYRSWAETNSGERDRLADHAAQLDKSLTEGRELVKEFRVALGQCERDLKALGEQIAMDRGLIGEE